jgi:hypothetical protein
MHRAGRRKMREGCCNGERLQRRQQHHHQQASFSPIRRWPISQRHFKSASPPAESGGLSPLESWKVQWIPMSVSPPWTSSTAAACVCERGRWGRSEERVYREWFVVVLLEGVVVVIIVLVGSTLGIKIILQG